MFNELIRDGVRGVFDLSGICLKEFFTRRRSSAKCGERQLALTRGSTLCGSWQGDGCDDLIQRVMRFSVTWELRLNEITREIRGSSMITYPGESPAIFDLDGRFLNDNYCCLLYHTREDGAVRFGCIIAQLAMRGNQMKGKFLGCSYREPKNVFSMGNVNLIKSSCCPSISL